MRDKIHQNTSSSGPDSEGVDRNHRQRVSGSHSRLIPPHPASGGPRSTSTSRSSLQTKPPTERSSDRPSVARNERGCSRRRAPAGSIPRPPTWHGEPSPQSTASPANDPRAVGGKTWDRRAARGKGIREDGYRRFQGASHLGRLFSRPGGAGAGPGLLTALGMSRVVSKLRSNWNSREDGLQGGSSPSCPLQCLQDMYPKGRKAGWRTRFFMIAQKRCG